MDRISVTMALDALTEQVEVVRKAEETLIRQRAIRDDLIRDARLSGGIGYRRLVNITGLSRDRLYTLINSPSLSDD